MPEFNEIAFVDLLRSKVQRLNDNFNRTDLTVVTHLDNAKRFLQEVLADLDQIQKIKPSLFEDKDFSNSEGLLNDYEELLDGAGDNEYTAVDVYGYLGLHFVAHKVVRVDAHEMDIEVKLCKTELEAKHLFRDSLIAAFREYLKDDIRLKWELEKVITENGLEHAETLTPDIIRLFLVFEIAKREAKK